MTPETLSNLDVAFSDCEDVDFTKRDDGKGRQIRGNGDYVNVVECVGDVPCIKAVGTGIAGIWGLCVSMWHMGRDRGMWV